MIDEIILSIARRPRKVMILYAEPMAHNIILDTGRFELKERLCPDFYQGTYWTYIYESKD